NPRGCSQTRPLDWGLKTGAVLSPIPHHPSHSGSLGVQNRGSKVLRRVEGSIHRIHVGKGCRSRIAKDGVVEQVGPGKRLPLGSLLEWHKFGSPRSQQRGLRKQRGKTSKP